MSRKAARVEKECFWTLACEGLSTTSFMHWKGDSIFGCYVTTGDAMDAERFTSKAKLTLAMKRDRSVKEFMENYPDAAPAKIVVKTEVYLHEHVAS